MSSWRATQPRPKFVSGKRCPNNIPELLFVLVGGGDRTSDIVSDHIHPLMSTSRKNHPKTGLESSVHVTQQKRHPKKNTMFMNVACSSGVCLVAKQKHIYGEPWQFSVPMNRSHATGTIVMNNGRPHIKYALGCHVTQIWSGAKQHVKNTEVLDNFTFFGVGVGTNKAKIRTKGEIWKISDH